MRCGVCDTDNRERVSFCEQCGASLGATHLADGTVTCHSCLFANRNGIAFCEQCSAPLGTASASITARVACQACAAANRPGVVYCEQCGTRLLDVVPTARRIRWRPIAWAAIGVVAVAGLAVGYRLIRGGGDATTEDLVRGLPDAESVTDCALMGDVASQYLSAAAAVGVDPDASGLTPEVATRGAEYLARMEALGCDGTAVVADIPVPPSPAEGASIEEVVEFLISGGDVEVSSQIPAEVSRGG